jgi:hypothetical protein
VNHEQQYIAVIPHVQEVIVVGAADLNFWRAHLQRADLFPFNANGNAQITVSATQFKWSGLCARELVISLAVCKRATEDARDGAYLIHAFNASRVLAFAERAFFQTPYAWGDTKINAHLPASVAFDDGAGARLRAQMLGASARLRVANELWEGTVFLPDARNIFFGKLGGQTQVYPFAATDEFEIQTSNRAPVFEWLTESRFTPQEWWVRTDATHARSKTFKRI